MAKKATHKGTCQVCGRVQKLPGGRLSNHGYNTTYGFFMGTCHGSGELPLEESCSVAQAQAKRLLYHAGVLEAEAEEILASESLVVGRIHYVGKTRTTQVRVLEAGSFRVEKKAWKTVVVADTLPPKRGHDTEWSPVGNVGYRDVTVEEASREHHAAQLRLTANKARAKAQEIQEMVDAWTPSALIPC